ncbi:hypothetical protein CATRI_01140 [Corynebacterium atrinae]|uniref:hypothetical protein n=1 Tax=Corynebacterium atrinae TaxID=1336740 RepID=UPI0025B3078E|nr:hypothetical protein [Corynebacterium atrinae]WJY62343.1 hypothetical protein CATRI_01140 [Corynebacterium atrinae]
MSLPTSRVRSWLVALLVALPLIIGTAVAALTGLDPAKSWNSDTEPAGAPVASSPTGIDPSQLVDARRAAGEAGSQAGFLVAGTGELVEGTGKMREGTAGVEDKFGAAVTGSQQLSQGMVELQAGMGQLGPGAIQVADGVGMAVDQVVGFGAFRGQLLTGIDQMLSKMEGSRDPEVIAARDQLLSLRSQAEVFELDEATSAQLSQLKSGSREIANQLGVPGYAFHDGIYSATKGSQELAAGLSQAQGGIDEALEGVDALAEGAVKIDNMAGQTQDRIGAIQRTLPVVQAAPTTGDAASESTRTLTPTYAMLIASLVLLGGAAAGAVAGLTRHRWAFLGAATAVFTALGVILLAILSTGLTFIAGALAAVVLALGVLTSAGLTHLMIRLLGPFTGSITAAVLGLAQIGLVGWVWKTASSAEVAPVWQILANLTPINWATSGLTALGNGGSQQALWLSLGVLVGTAVLGVLGMRTGVVRVDEVEASE